MGSTRAALVVATLATLAGLVAPEPVRADDSYRAVIDRADLEPSAIGGMRLRIYLSAVAIQGQLLDVTEPKAIKAIVGGAELKAPYAVGGYGATGADTAIVLVVQATAAYGDVLPVIEEALGSELLGVLSDKTTQVALLSYGDAIGTGKLTAMKPARARLAQLASDASTEDPALLETVERALILLKKEKLAREGKPLRELVIVVGDGRDRSGDRDRVARVGKRAATEGVRIHTVGYSPTDTRRPLLLLGELSKRSLGTFRWVRGAKADSWTAALDQLRDEVTRQDVVTFFLPDDADVAGKKVKLQTIGRTETTSNEIVIPKEATCGSAACDTGYCAANQCIVPAERGAGDGVLGFILELVGGAVALLALLVGVGYVLSKRAGRIEPGVLAPGATQSFVASGAAAAPRPEANGKGKTKSKTKSKPPVSRPPGVAPAPAVLASGKPAPVMFMLGGARDGQRVHLKHGFTIGKDPACDLVIEDGFTSSVHAKIGMDTFGNCRLYDNNSTNGLYVNGVRVSEYALQHGVSVKIGATEMRFLAQ